MRSQISPGARTLEEQGAIFRALYPFDYARAVALTDPHRGLDLILEVILDQIRLAESPRMDAAHLRSELAQIDRNTETIRLLHEIAGISDPLEIM